MTGTSGSLVFFLLKTKSVIFRLHLTHFTRFEIITPGVLNPNFHLFITEWDNLFRFFILGGDGGSDLDLFPFVPVVLVFYLNDLSFNVVFVIVLFEVIHVSVTRIKIAL